MLDGHAPGFHDFPNLPAKNSTTSQSIHCFLQHPFNAILAEVAGGKRGVGQG